MLKDLKEIDYVKEYLKNNGYNSTLECLEKEEKYKIAEKLHSKVISFKNNIIKLQSPSSDKKESYLSQTIHSYTDKTKKISLLKDAYLNLSKKNQAILQCARQVYAIVISFIQNFQELQKIFDISELTEENRKKTEDFYKKLDYYKVQVAKYSHILMGDEYDEKNEFLIQEIILEHKYNLNSAKKNEDKVKIMEILLSLRLNALQINPNLRKNFINELIKKDILFIKDTNNNFFVNELLNIQSYQIRHAILSVISIISSTYDGVNYLLSNNTEILSKIIQIIKGTEDGQVLQRFCISILNKMSIKKETIEIFLNFGIIDWIIKLLQRSRINKINQFCIDFSSALLANILGDNATIKFLENNDSVCRNLMEAFLSMIGENISPTLLKHFLMCLSYLNNKKFDKIKEECKFDQRIDDFKQKFLNLETQNEEEETQKHFILDLMKNIFGKNEQNEDDKEKEEKFQNLINEYENLKGKIVFECFQDEVY